jgi:serine protease Do
MERQPNIFHDKDEVPFVNPTSILKFFNEHPIKVFSRANPRIGEKVEIPNISLVDYFLTIPEKYRNNPPYISEYHNALLRMAQKLINEGLLTPVGNKTGFEQEMIGNSFHSNEYVNYGYYDFLIYGFPAIRDNFEKSVYPIIIDQNVRDKDEDIGTGFAVQFKGKMYFVTARHCLPIKSKITITPYSPSRPQSPIKCFVHKDRNIDIAVLEFSDRILLSPRPFIIGKPHILDPVLTMGYPPIQGMTDAIQIAETSAISSSLKSSKGQVVGKGKHYWGGLEDHFLISARVKGGCSGSPIINRYGFVIGVVIEIPQNKYEVDLLGYGLGISSSVLIKMLNKITGDSDPIEIVEMKIKQDENGFQVSLDS